VLFDDDETWEEEGSAEGGGGVGEGERSRLTSSRERMIQDFVGWGRA
jgi:hypothetical protein